MQMNHIMIGGEDYPKNGWAVIFAGGAASGKSSLIRDKRLHIEGTLLSTDNLGEDIIDIHNNAKRYEKENPELLTYAEKMVSTHDMYGRIKCPKNIHLDLDSPTCKPGFMASILHNGAEKQKKAIFRETIEKNAACEHSNIIIDMTGQRKAVETYVEMLRNNGYRIALVWVITNRSQAIVWNASRQRTIMLDALHTYHDGPNSYLPTLLQENGRDYFDDAWIVFNSTEQLGKTMTDEEREAIQLEKSASGYTIDDKLRERIHRVCGPLSSDRPKPYMTVDATEKNMERYKMMQKMAQMYQKECPAIGDVLVSFLQADKKKANQNIKQFYEQLGIEEPKILPRPSGNAFDVNEPVRQQFKTDEEYEEAVRLYPEQQADYEKALIEWNNYYEQFKIR